MKNEEEKKLEVSPENVASVPLEDANKLKRMVVKRQIIIQTDGERIDLLKVEVSKLELSAICNLILQQMGNLKF